MPRSAAGAPTVTSAWLYEHKRLRRSINALALRRQDPPRLHQPSLLLLGIISVSVERRSLLRCTWVKMLEPLPARVRFVLGRNASDAGAPDTLQVPVEERLLAASSNRARTRSASGATYSSLSSFLKTYHFLKFAAGEPEPLVGLADDDVFISPQMLVAQYAAHASNILRPRNLHLEKTFAAILLCVSVCVLITTTCSSTRSQRNASPRRAPLQRPESTCRGWSGGMVLVAGNHTRGDRLGTHGGRGTRERKSDLAQL